MNSELCNTLSQLLDSITSPTFGYIELESGAALVSRGNPYYGLTIKRSQLTVLFGYNFDNAVNVRREKLRLPTDYEEGDRPWGERVGPARVTNKGNNYLEYQIVCRWSTVYICRGEEISESDIEPYKKKRKDKVTFLTPEEFLGMNEDMVLDWAVQNVNVSSPKYSSLTYFSIDLPDGLVELLIPKD